MKASPGDFFDFLTVDLVSVPVTESIKLTPEYCFIGAASTCDNGIIFLSLLLSLKPDSNVF